MEISQLVAGTSTECFHSFPEVLGAGSFYKVVGQRGDRILCCCHAGSGQNRGKTRERPFWVCLHFGCGFQQHSRVGYIRCSLLEEGVQDFTESV